MGKLRFPLFSAGIETLGDLNPQLMREMQGRLKLRNVLITLLCSLMAQGCFLFWKYRSLRLALGTCKEASGLKGQECVQVGTHYFQVNWQTWWLDVFSWGSYWLLLILVVGGSFMLMSDLSKEERRGTLTFISLSPQSARTILMGKLLGVPILVFLAVAIALPLHYASGFSAQIPALKIVCFDVLGLGACSFFYSLALLIGLVGHWLNGFQAWLGSAVMFGFLQLLNNFQISESAIDWLYAFTPMALLPYVTGTNIPDFPHHIDLLDWHWFRIPIGSGGPLILFFLMANYGIWTGWLWQPLQRRFRNPRIPLLGKKQSYGATACFIACSLGFSMTAGGNSEAQIGFLMIAHMLWFLLLMVLLLPQHQALQDWARFRGSYQSVTGRIQRTKDLLWADNSPAWVAIAINLGIANLPIVIWALFHLQDDQMPALMGLLINSTLILIIALFNQVVLLLPIANRNLWTIATLILPVALPLTLVILFGAEPTNEGSGWFLFTPLSFLAIKSTTSVAQVLQTFVIQLGAIAGLTWQLNRQLKRAGESTTEKLFRQEAPLQLGN